MKRLSIIHAYLLAGLMMCNQSCQRHELHLASTPEAASVTYTVPLYIPSLEWAEYVITYTDSMGISRTDTILGNNFNADNNIFITSEANDFFYQRKPDKAFWVRNETFRDIPDSCIITVGMRHPASKEPPNNIDLIIPQPHITAVVRFSDDYIRSYIGKGLDCNVMSVEKGTADYYGIFQKEYACSFHFIPSISISDYMQ